METHLIGPAGNRINGDSPAGNRINGDSPAGNRINGDSPAINVSSIYIKHIMFLVYI